jgi:hypothetical protein
MIVFDMLRIRCFIASLAKLGHQFSARIAAVWNQLSIEPAPSADLIRHPWCGDFFAAGQPLEIARSASWLNFGHGSNSPGRIVAWPSVGVPGRWPPAVAMVSRAILRGSPHSDRGNSARLGLASHFTNAPVRWH